MAKWQDDSRNLDTSVFGGNPGETFRGTNGNDSLVGTDLADIFKIQQGGRDHVNGGQGRDTIYAGASLTPKDRFNGGAGTDTLVLEGDYSSGLTLQSDTVARLEYVNLLGDFNYAITLAPNMRHDKGFFAIDATQAFSLHLDGSAMNFLLAVYGSSGDDIMIGGTGGDGFVPSSGFDVLTGGGGLDTFYFNFTSDSLPSVGDVITDFDGDRINLSSVDGNTQKSGDQDLHFGATPGHTGDVTVAYDAGQDVTFVNVFTDDDANPDMVIQLTGDHSDLTAADFIL